MHYKIRGTITSSPDTCQVDSIIMFIQKKITETNTETNNRKQIKIVNVWAKQGAQITVVLLTTLQVLTGSIGVGSQHQAAQMQSCSTPL
jgi:hypothetical protein